MRISYVWKNVAINADNQKTMCKRLQKSADPALKQGECMEKKCETKQLADPNIVLNMVLS